MSPPGWKWLPLKRVADINTTILPENTDPEYTFRYIDIGSVNGNGELSELEELRFGDAPSRARRIVRPGDVIVSTVRTYLRAIARVPTGCRDLIASTGFGVLSARPELDPRYLYWWARSTPFVEEVVARSVGVGYPAIAPDDLGHMRMPIPPRAEQRAIGDFLDRETARIDSLVEKHDAVGGALKRRFWIEVGRATHAEAALPNPPDGQVPIGWHQLQLKRCFARMDYGLGGRSAQSGMFPVLGMTQVGRGNVFETSASYVDSVPEGFFLELGDLLFNRTNSLPLVGKVGMFRGQPGRTTFASYLVRLRVAPGHYPDYLNYVLNSSEVLGLARSMALPSIGQANLNPNRYGRIRIWVPDFQEQRKVAGGLDELALRVHRTQEALAQQVELLRERRQALITAAVTGHVDIVGTAA